MEIYFSLYKTGTDPGFPVGGGANFRGGAPRYKFARFPRKLHEIKKKFCPGGAGSAPLVPPLQKSDFTEPPSGWRSYFFFEMDR